MSTKDYNHIYDCILNAIEDDFNGDEEAQKDAACVIFTRLLTGDKEEKNDIIDEYDLDCCRVCDICGELMVEGWYIADFTYLCSDECAAKWMKMTPGEFDRYKIYSDEIDHWLECEGKGRKKEDLTKEELEDIMDDFIENVESYWTEWY